MVIKIFSYEKFSKGRDRGEIGSARIRVHNLIKYWQEADFYKFGENPDVLIFQKVCLTEDYVMPRYFKGIKILDICDPIWLEGYLVKETVDVVDAVVAPTKAICDFMKQLTDKPVVQIKDRFDLSEFPKPRKHDKPLKKVVWFGYAHNAELLKFAMPTLERLDLDLLVVANEDPMPYRWCKGQEYKSQHYAYKKYLNETAYSLIQTADACILPEGNRPEDVFKSENKSVIANLLGLPVLKTLEDIEHYTDPANRNKFIADNYDKIRQEYDVMNSIREYQDLIGRLRK